MESKLEIIWFDKMENRYPYKIYRRGENIPSVPGNFCFAKEPAPNQWSAVYFGETDNLSKLEQKLDEILKSCVNSFAATHVHIRENSNAEDRQLEVQSLTEKWNPICNNIHKSS